jgi:anti-sigma-K factor RskA
MTEDERRQTRLDDEAQPGRLRPDDLFITKYVMNSLSPDERARFEARLEDDDHF